MNAYTPYLIPVSIKAILFEGNSVWLRFNERKEWELPGGKIDPGEQPIQTVVREIQEELGFDIKCESLIEATVFQIPKSVDENYGVLVLSYLGQILKKGGPQELIEESGAAKFELHDVNSLSDLPMPDFYKRAIEKAWRISKK